MYRLSLALALSALAGCIGVNEEPSNAANHCRHLTDNNANALIAFVALDNPAEHQHSEWDPESAHILWYTPSTRPRDDQGSVDFDDDGCAILPLSPGQSYQFQGRWIDGSIHWTYTHTLDNAQGTVYLDFPLEHRGYVGPA